MMKQFGSGSARWAQKGKFNHIQYSLFPCEILHRMEKTFLI